MMTTLSATVSEIFQALFQINTPLRDKYYYAQFKNQKRYREPAQGLIKNKWESRAQT